MAKLTKRDIQETLEKIPVETLLTGKAKTRELTKKQTDFAKNLALGMPKAQAYRKAYNSKGTAKTVAVHGSALSKREDIQIIAKGFREAFEAREYQKPAQIRELIIHNLLKMSLSDEVKDAQRIKSLELLGKLSDVQAFSEQKTTTVIHESSKLKEKLLDQLKNVIDGDIKEVGEDEGDQLLRELMGEGVKNDYPSDPTYPADPQKNLTTPLATSHIIPHTQSAPESDSNSVPTKLSSENNDLLTVNVYSEKKEGVGVDEKASDAGWVETGKAPLSDLGTMVDGEG